jgi:Kef-type K+ transport system membrane component KefB
MVSMLIHGAGARWNAAITVLAARTEDGRADQGDVIFHVLLALAAVVIVGLALGKVCVHLGQPAVICEVVAGILLGPSLLGKIAPSAAAFLLPASVAPYLGVVAQLGVILYMFLVVRPLASRLAARIVDGQVTRGVAGLVFVALLLSSLATEIIGIHAIFGAFLLGAVIPHDSAIARALTDKLEDIVTVLLLPAFFAFTGMRTEIGLVTGMEQWLVCGLIILVATAGKFGGTALAARLTGLAWREASALGILMNTRGLMELIVLNIGYDLKVISPSLFAMLVLMALVTTIATTPVLQLLVRTHLMPPARPPKN